MSIRIVSKAVNGEYTYILTEAYIRTEETDSIRVYGIGIYGDGGSARIDDISPDADSMRMLFELICQEQLYPEHLYDVVEDHLSELR